MWNVPLLPRSDGSSSTCSEPTYITVETVSHEAPSQTGDPHAMQVVAGTFVQTASAISAAVAVVLLGVGTSGAGREWLVFGALMAGHAGLGAWPLNREGPDPLVHSAALALAVTWLLFFSPSSSVVIPMAAAGALGLASVFGHGRRLIAYLVFLWSIWVVELGAIAWHISAFDLPVSHHTDEVVGLVLQVGLFGVTRVVVSRVPPSARATDSLYGNLFANAPTSLW